MGIEESRTLAPGTGSTALLVRLILHAIGLNKENCTSEGCTSALEARIRHRRLLCDVQTKDGAAALGLIPENVPQGLPYMDASMPSV